MHTLFADHIATLTDLKQHPERLLKQVETATVAILENHHPCAYLISADLYKELLERLEDSELGLLIRQREVEKPHAIEVSLDDL